jgi:hypothetical protein
LVHTHFLDVFLKFTNPNFAEVLRSGTKIPADVASRAAGFAGLASTAQPFGIYRGV